MSLPPASEADEDALVAVVAALLCDPWRLTIFDVAELTDRQLYQLYAHPRDEYGRVKTKQPDEATGPLLSGELVLSPDDEMRMFFESSREWGVAKDEAERQWAEKRGPVENPPPWLVVLRANWR